MSLQLCAIRYVIVRLEHMVCGLDERSARAALPALCAIEPVSVQWDIFI